MEDTSGGSRCTQTPQVSHLTPSHPYDAAEICMNHSFQRALASIGLVGVISLLGYIIYLLAAAAASFVDESYRSLAMSVSSVSIFGFMVFVSIAIGRLLDDGVEVEY